LNLGHGGREDQVEGGGGGGGEKVKKKSGTGGRVGCGCSLDVAGRK